MKKNLIRNRTILMTVLFGTVMLVYGIRLMQLQIVRGEDYLNQLNKGTSKTQLVKAARGEIVDREGKPFTYNKVVYNVVFDRAFLDEEKENEVILQTAKILSDAGISWIDSLPITKTAPFAFLPDSSAKITKLKKILNVGEYTSVNDVVYWLRDKFALEQYNDQDFRTLAGVKFEMLEKDFSYSNPYTFAVDVDIQTAMTIKELGYQLGGVEVIESAMREYANGDLIPHVIGRVGPIYAEELSQRLEQGYRSSDYVGKDGIELAYEQNLRGKDGTKRIYFNSKGEVTDSVEETPAQPGNTIVLTIDQDMQRVGIEALAQQIKNLNETAPEGKGKEAEAGAVAAIQIKTGDILSLVTYPSYNQSTYNQDYQELVNDSLRPLWNRALFGRYAPGSIFKPGVAIATLNENIETEQSHINCTQVYGFYPDSPFTCLSHHGLIDVKNALKYSCNIYFYDAGRRLGIEKINQYQKKLGLAAPTGIELTEFSGKLSSPELAKEYGVAWNPGDVVQSAIGQMYNEFSPIQLANYTATLANNGKRMDLNIVKSITSYNQDQTIYERVPLVVSEMPEVDPKHFETVREGMVMASRTGTAVATFGNYFVDVASKTGTPQTVQFPNSTFIAYAPAEDPEIAIVVVIEKGWHGYTGAPVAKAVFDKYFEKYGKVKPPEVVQREQAQAEAQKSGTESSPDESASTSSPLTSSQAQETSSQITTQP